MESLNQVREQVLRDYFPRIADLRTQVHITFWSDHHLLSQPLLDILPFGQTLDPESFYRYHDYQFPRLLEQARGNLLYWLISDARQFDGNPVSQITLFFDDTFLWHYYVPAKAQEIKESIRSGNRIRFLSRFHLSQSQVEVEFNEIRLRTITETEEQFVYTDSREYTYKWSQRFWDTTLINHEIALINPNVFTIPIAAPNTLGREDEYQARLEQILGQWIDIPIGTHYWNSVDSTRINTPVEPSNSITDSDETWDQRASPPLPRLVCHCGIDVCYCNTRDPGTPPTPPYIELWEPSTRTQPLNGVHYQRN